MDPLEAYRRHAADQVNAYRADLLRRLDESEQIVAGMRERLATVRADHPERPRLERLVREAELDLEVLRTLARYIGHRIDERLG